MAKLTPLQKDELIQQYVELCVDGMDHKDMYHFIYNTLAEDFDKLSDLELQDEIRYSFDEETLDELIENVTQEVV
jgi:adenine C2-methylase RlmN of 23S rRNA A2503 and tRNA A37